MSTPSLEERVAALETAIRQMRSEENRGKPWLQKVAGILADEPEFAKVIEYGRYWREHGHEPPPEAE